jgi:mRNA interferase MazF
MPRWETAVKVERYAVHWVNLDPVVGSEISKTRPAAIVSDDAMNAHLGTVVVCPITSRLHPRWPFRVQTRVAGKAAEIAVDQIRTIARLRIGSRAGVLQPASAAAVRHVITLMYGVLSVSVEDR